MVLESNHCLKDEIECFSTYFFGLNKNKIALTIILDAFLALYGCGLIYQAIIRSKFSYAVLGVLFFICIAVTSTVLIFWYRRTTRKYILQMEQLFLNDRTVKRKLTFDEKSILLESDLRGETLETFLTLSNSANILINIPKAIVIIEGFSEDGEKKIIMMKTRTDELIIYCRENKLLHKIVKK